MRLCGARTYIIRRLGDNESPGGGRSTSSRPNRYGSFSITVHKNRITPLTETDGNVLSRLVVGQPMLLCQAVFIALGLLLLSAAGFKTYQAYSEPPDSSPIAILTLVCLEICFGVWLVVGARTNWTWRATVTLFAIFACVSGYKALSGATSCGCFGAIQLNPWVALGTDVFALSLLLLCRTGVDVVTHSTICHLFLRAALAALPISLVATAVVIYGSSRFVSLDGREADVGAFVVLEPAFLDRSTLAAS